MNAFTLIDPNFTLISGIKTFFSSFVSLFVMVDPFAAIPIYLMLTKQMSPADTLDTTRKCVYIAGGILLFFGLTGIGLLNLFGISLAALRVAGGLLLLKFAFEQMSGSPEKIKADEEAESLRRDSIAIVPLAMPLLAGPGSISTVIVKAANAKNLVSLMIVIVSLIIVMWVSYLTLRSSRHLFKILGKTGINILEKLMGIIVAALAIQFIITGLRESFPNL